MQDKGNVSTQGGERNVILGYLLKRYRDDSGMSQRALGKKANVRPALISEIETGKKQNTLLSTAERLAKALEISLEKLLREDSLDPYAAWHGCPLAGMTSVPGEQHSLESIVCLVV